MQLVHKKPPDCVCGYCLWIALSLFSLEVSSTCLLQWSTPVFTFIRLHGGAFDTIQQSFVFFFTFFCINHISVSERKLAQTSWSLRETSVVISALQQLETSRSESRLTYSQHFKTGTTLFRHVARCITFCVFTSPNSLGLRAFVLNLHICTYIGNYRMSNYCCQIKVCAHHLYYRAYGIGCRYAPVQTRLPQVPDSGDDCHFCSCTRL